MTVSARAAALQAQKRADAAAHDERVTRQRVDHLEAFAAQAAALFGRGFWGRLKWLVTGK